MSIRVAVVGAGTMGADHARIIAQDIPGAQLQVVCDATEDRARIVADRFGAIRHSTDAVATIARDDVDAVLIASPDDTHADLTIAAIKLGKPVLCEKPLAANSEDSLRVIAAETAFGKNLVQVGFMRRFDPTYVAMRSVRQNGKIGAALMMHNFHRNVEAPPEFTDLMAITNSAPHEFDIARHMLGSEMVAISAFQPMRSTGGAVAPVVMVLESSAGQLVTIEVNNNARYGYDVRGELVGESGSISLAAPADAVINEALQSVSVYPEDWRPRFAEAYRLQNKAWIESIEADEPSKVAANSWDGYCATAVAEAGARSLSIGHKVSIELEDRPDLYPGLGEAAA